MLEGLKQQLEAERNNLAGQLDIYKKDDPLRDPDQSLSHTQDDVITVSEGHDRIDATRRELKIRLREVEKALGKIENGKYGICENCGNKIVPERLKANPTAVFCMDCERKVQR
ncbi:MAG: TraR/DksA C4-type zinc finger protein [Candidatus Woykebacteria bacterium]